MTRALAETPAPEYGAAVPLDLGTAARIMRDATKDKSYQETPLGQEVAAYLRQKRKRLTASSYRNYEGILHKLVIDHADLRLEDFAPPAGTDLVEAFMDRRWGDGSARAYNRNFSITKDFFKWAQQRRGLQGDPTILIERAKAGQTWRTTFTPDETQAIIASCTLRNYQLACRLLLHYGLRNGAIRAIQIRHFDHQRRRLTIFTKGRKVREIPIPQTDFWQDLERYILDAGAEPTHYLLPARKLMPVGPRDQRPRPQEWRYWPEKPMSATSIHNWWKERLADAGVGYQKMHAARHTAGQRMLDRTGNLKAVQALLGHADIGTTANIYTDWDIDRLADSLTETFRSSDQESPANGPIEATTGIEPVNRSDR